jgi:integrase
VTLAYYTGWRVNSEILTLQCHQIDRKAGVIRLEPGTTKNRDGRVFKYGEILEVQAAIDGSGHATKHSSGSWSSRPLSSGRRKGQEIRTFWKR